jgi:hypothetical protein
MEKGTGGGGESAYKVTLDWCIYIKEHGAMGREAFAWMVTSVPMVRWNE